jgi:branched-chain amino acid transport system substrate-binding protein
MALAAAFGFSFQAQAADKKTSPGVTATEIKLGQSMPYSGPLSAYSVIGKAEAGYFQMINDKGGINGRKVTLISRDDGYNPAKTVEVTRQLVEQEQVLAIVGTLGAPTNAAIRKYLNDKKVPQLFVASGATEWGDHARYAWTMGWQPSYQVEGHIYARYIMDNYPKAKVAVLYQNDDSGRDYLKGITDGFGAQASTYIVKAISFEVTDPTVDSQVVALKASGADVFFNAASPKAAAQAIRKSAELGWKPVQFVASNSGSIPVLKAAGFDNAAGIITAAYQKDPTDKAWANDPAMLEWKAWMKRYNPGANLEDSFSVYGYLIAMTTAHVLQQCGEDLSRENVMKQAASIANLPLPLLLPGIAINTAPDNYYPVRQMRLQKFDGKGWTVFSPVLGG